MGHNCGTCNNRREAECQVNIVYALYTGNPPIEMRFDTHPSDQHPCAHGEAVVASAVAGYEFREFDDGRVYAFHQHGLQSVRHGAWLSEDGTRWYVGTGKFCDECGLLLATAAQLPEMYERWQAANSK
jgi:hypothetical protein